MSKIVVSGLINIETTVKIESFPLNYYPVTYPFFGVRSTVSGVGYNVATALHTLGNDVTLCAMVGDDLSAKMVDHAIEHVGLKQTHILRRLKETPQSAILYDDSGQRQIHVDLKEIQETDYPLDKFKTALDGVQVAAMCNINFSRKLLPEVQARHIPIATDVHELSDLHDAYNQDYLRAATILFMSGGSLPTTPRNFIDQVAGNFPAEIIVIGLGARGAVMYTRGGAVVHVPAVAPRPIINTVGAGDALFSAFVHSFAQGIPPHAALKRAVFFAGHKIGERGAAEGFLTEAELLRLMDAS